MDEGRQRAWGFAGPAEVLGEIARVVPGFRGLDYEAIGDQGWQRPAPQAAIRRTLARVESGVPPRDPDYPLNLVTGRLLYDRGTLLCRSERIQSLVPPAYVMIHPRDAEKLDLVEGDDVSVVSAQGQLRLSLRVSDQVVPGVAFAPGNLSDVPLSVLAADCWTMPQVRVVKGVSHSSFEIGAP